MTNKNQPAFARPYSQYETHEGTEPVPSQEGLTKREYFAGLAMQGMLANPNLNSQWDIDQIDQRGRAMIAKIMADALIAELEKETLKP